MFRSQYEKSRTCLDRYHNKYGDWRKECIFDAGKKGKQQKREKKCFVNTYAARNYLSKESWRLKIHITVKFSNSYLANRTNKVFIYNFYPDGVVELTNSIIPIF